MTGGTTESESNLKTETVPKSESKTDEVEGFRFALTTIISLSTLGYTIYNYMVNNPINPTVFAILNIFFYHLV